jgi:hypothetical protein
VSGENIHRLPRVCSPLAILLLVAGCSPPLKAERLSGPESYAQLNRTALMGNFLSERTLTVLRRHALLDAWKLYPDAAIARLRDEVVRQPDAWPGLFALAELNYLQGERDGSKPYFLAAAVYAYAFLFPADDLAGPGPFDPEFRQACDIYNLGLTSAFAGINGGAVQLASGARALPFGQIDLDVDEDTSRLIGRLVILTLAITRAGAEVLSGIGDGIFISGAPARLGSIYSMSPNSAFIESLAAIPVAPRVHAHSIIAVANEGPLEDGSDGVVRYTSAHIDDAESELVVQSGHSTQANPATIGEVQRILLKQLAVPSGTVAVR